MNHFIGKKIKEDWQTKKFKLELSKLKYLSELLSDISQTITNIYF
jgi:hypothetical protein